MPYNLNTKTTQSSGPENICPERPLPSLLALVPVLSPSWTTLKKNEKIRPQPDRENAFKGATGGGKGNAVEPSLPRKSLITIDFAILKSFRNLAHIDRVGRHRHRAGRHLQVARIQADNRKAGSHESIMQRRCEYASLEPNLLKAESRGSRKRQAARTSPSPALALASEARGEGCCYCSSQRSDIGFGNAHRAQQQHAFPEP